MTEIVISVIGAIISLLAIVVMLFWFGGKSDSPEVQARRAELDAQSKYIVRLELDAARWTEHNKALQEQIRTSVQNLPAKAQDEWRDELDTPTRPAANFFGPDDVGPNFVALFGPDDVGPNFVAPEMSLDRAPLESHVEDPSAFELDENYDWMQIQEFGGQVHYVRGPCQHLKVEKVISNDEHVASICANPKCGEQLPPPGGWE